MSLRTEVYGLLDKTKRLCSGISDAQALVEMLTELRNRLEQPLRVAVVGEVKAGKSTFMNALMQANIVFTGTEEKTFTVCWFRYAKTPSLTVYFREGKCLDAPFEDLEKWSVRDASNKRLNEVAYVVIHYPSEVLKTIEFIDTPGLNSAYGTDAQNTMDFLSLRGSEETLHEAGKADAVIFAFARTLTDMNRKTLLQFHGNEKSGTSPINSIGIFTRLDGGGAWDVEEDSVNPVEKAKPRTVNFMRKMEIKRLLYSILPICAKPAEGYYQLNAQDWQVLKRIAQKDRGELQELLIDASEFKRSVEKEYMEYGTTEERGSVMDKLASYGILEITDQLRSGKSEEEIGDILQKNCGIDDVRQLVNQHFGNRTFLIKTKYIFNQLYRIVYKIQYDTNSSAELKEIGNYIRDEMERMTSSVQTLRELTALQMYYNRELEELTEEEQNDLLRVTGEYGRLPEQRLQVEEGTSITDMAAIAQKKAVLWNGKATDWLMSAAYIEVCSIVARSYESMYYHLNALIEE